MRVTPRHIVEHAGCQVTYGYAHIANTNVYRDDTVTARYGFIRLPSPDSCRAAYMTSPPHYESVEPLRCSRLISLYESDYERFFFCAHFLK